MKWSNAIENRVLTVANFMVFWLIVWFLVLPVYKTQIKTLESQIEQKDQTIIQLSKIARYAITNDFDKLKTTGNSNITLDLNNDMDVKSKQLDIMQTDSITDISVKQSFWKRLFNTK